MFLIKLNATDSTNSYIKDLAQKQDLNDFTVVVAKYQKKGRGQMGTMWESESGKNLTFSVFTKFLNYEIDKQFYLSMAVSLALINVIKQYVNTPIYIKWPNDILAENNKIAGILIENTIKLNKIKSSIIGIGLNINQSEFSDSIKNVTSLRNLLGKNVNEDVLLEEIIRKLKTNILELENQNFDKIKIQYLKFLYKYNESANFIDYNDRKFIGKIIDISKTGKLIVKIKSEMNREFGLKEISFL